MGRENIQSLKIAKQKMYFSHSHLLCPSLNSKVVIKGKDCIVLEIFVFQRLRNCSLLNAAVEEKAEAVQQNEQQLQIYFA